MRAPKLCPAMLALAPFERRMPPTAAIPLATVSIGVIGVDVRVVIGRAGASKR